MSNEEFVFEGKVYYIFPDNYAIDGMIGPKALMQDKEMDIEVLKGLAMKEEDPDFAKNAVPGDFLVAGKNFGHGHNHFQCMWTMRELGLNVVLADSFQPCFYRNEIHNGMFFLAVPGISKKVKKGDKLKVEFLKGKVTNLTTGEEIQGKVPGEILVDILREGDLAAYIESRKAE